jgi:hypothetical protein
VLLIAGQSIADYADGIEELGFDRGLRPRAGTRARSYGLFFVAVGAALWASGTDLARFGSDGAAAPR